MQYRNALPYFPAEDIPLILNEIEDILSGNGFLTKGPKVKEFESRFAAYTGCDHAIAVNSCTTALEIVLKAIGVSRGDEVIVPVQTFIATASAVATVGGTPVFCDSNPDFLIDFEDVKRKITEKTKAVIIVHFAGLIHKDILAIKTYLNEQNIYLIEDCAHAHGAKINGKMNGSIGDFGCHSFFSTKIMTTGEGGMITTNDPEAAGKCASIRSIGIDTTSNVEIFSNIGTNNRLAEIPAILGTYQLGRLNGFVERRIEIAQKYAKMLEPLISNGTIRLQVAADGVLHPYWKFIVFLENSQVSRDDLRIKLSSQGINIDSPYNPLVHLQPVFKKMYQTSEGDHPMAEALSKKHFALPMHVQLSDADVIFIGSAVVKALSA